MKELERLNKLLERKREYLQRCENPKTKDIIQSEINIIEGFKQAVIDNQNQYAELWAESESFMQKQIVLIDSLITICLMHGINDFEAFLNKGLPLLRDEFLRDHSENIVRIPNQLIKIIHGEK